MANSMTPLPVVTDISLLIKDPEVGNKTWTVQVDRHTTVAEVIRSFLMRRNGDLAQACQLRLLFGGVPLSDELDSSLEDFGVAGARCLLHSMWRPSAGGCLNSSSCPNCRKISSAGQPSTPRKGLAATQQRREDDSIVLNTNVAGGSVTDPVSGHQAVIGGGERGDVLRGDRGSHKKDYVGVDASVRGDKRKDKDRRHRNDTDGEGERQRVRDVFDRFSRRGGPLGASPAATDLLLVLERLVSTCGHATDVVTQLERLNKLHKHGALTGEEYARAKQQVLCGDVGGAQIGRLID